MSIFTWVVLGLVVGSVTSKLVTGSRRGLLLDLVLGVVGALVGGAAFHVVGHLGVLDFDLWSLLVAVLAAIFVLALFHALVDGSSRRA